MHALEIADRCGEFNRHAVRLDLAIQYQVFLSDKQIRDAFYRLRCKGYDFRHLGRGVYKLNGLIKRSPARSNHPKQVFIKSFYADTRTWNKLILAWERN